MFVSVAVLVTIVSGIIFFIYGTSSINARTDDQLNSVVVLKERQFENFLETAQGAIDELSKSEAILDYLKEFHSSEKDMLSDYKPEKEDESEKGIAPELENKLNYIPFSELFLIPKEGIVDFSTDPMQEGKLKLSEEYFTEGLNSLYVQNYFYDPSIGESSIVVSAPVKDEQGNVFGVIAGRINQSKISDIMDERAGLGETGETYIVNKFNFPVTQLKFSKSSLFHKAIYTEGVKDCLKGNSGHMYYEGYSGTIVTGAYVWLPEREICIVAEINEEEVNKITGKLKEVVILNGVGLLMISSFLSIMLSYMITSPISRLKDAAKKIGKGNFDVKLKSNSRDEVGELAAVFNKAASDLKILKAKLIESEVKKSAELEKIVKKRTKELEAKNKEFEDAKAATMNILEDVTEANKRLKELDKGKDEFLSMVSHELKTPLTPIQVHLEMLSEPGSKMPAKEQTASIEAISRNTKRLKSLINDILDISRLQLGRMQFSMAKLNLNKIIEDVLKDRQLVADSKKIKLKAETEGRLDVTGDSLRLMQVLTNLLDNAVKFSDENSEIQVVAKKQGSRAHVEVIDKGIGIAEDKIPNLFSKFYQVDSTIQRKFGGTGLGLAISKGIIEAHKGEIGVRSQLGKGSAFYFSIPINNKR
jgi:signal transduction histidine kinase